MTRIRRLAAAALHLVVRSEPAHQVCPNCNVDFVPALTDFRCPIDGWLAVPPGEAPAPRVPHRGTAGLGLAWFVGVVAFALLAHALYG